MQYYQVYCPQHPYDLVTNFCNDKQCLVGCCATCVCQHTEYHLRKGVPPQYENVKDTYIKYNEIMSTQLAKLEQDKQWLSLIYKNIDQKRMNVRSTLAKAREETLRAVNKHFDDLQHKIQHEILCQGKKNSLHSKHRLQTLNTLLNKQMTHLMMHSKDVSSPKFLQALPVIHDDVIPNSQQFHLRISKELKENEIYTANAVYKDQCMPDVLFALKRLVNLEFLLPKVEFPVQFRRDDFRKSQSLKKNQSAIFVSSTVPSSPKRMVLSSYPQKSHIKLNVNVNTTPTREPIHYIFQQSSLKNQSQMTNPSKLGRMAASRLKVIHETNRESNQDTLKNLSSSSVAYFDKENEGITQSTYYDSGLNFFSR